MRVQVDAATRFKFDSLPSNLIAASKSNYRQRAIELSCNASTTLCGALRLVCTDEKTAHSRRWAAGFVVSNLYYAQPWTPVVATTIGVHLVGRHRTDHRNLTHVYVRFFPAKFLRRLWTEILETLPRNEDLSATDAVLYDILQIFLKGWRN